MREKKLILRIGPYNTFFQRNILQFFKGTIFRRMVKRNCSITMKSDEEKNEFWRNVIWRVDLTQSKWSKTTWRLFQPLNWFNKIWKFRRKNLKRVPWIHATHPSFVAIGLNKKDVLQAGYILQAGWLRMKQSRSTMIPLGGYFLFYFLTFCIFLRFCYELFGLPRDLGGFLRKFFNNIDWKIHSFKIKAVLLKINILIKLNKSFKKK